MVLPTGRSEVRDTTMQVKAAFKATWASITPQQCHMWIASMPRHTDAVFQAKGGPTKYLVHTCEHFSEGRHFCIKNPCFY